MRTYILVLIIIFTFILFNHLLSFREGLEPSPPVACLDQSAITNYNQNANAITTQQGLVAQFLSDVEAAEAAVARNTSMLAANWTHNNQLKTAVCPDKCPGIDHGDGSDHTYVCAVGCCDLQEHWYGDDCVNPWNTKKHDVDKKGEEEAVSSTPDAGAKAAGITQAGPSEKASSAI